MKYFFSTLFCFALLLNATAQKLTVGEYIETYKDMAIREMHRSGIPASITLAQGLLETENGNSDLVRRSNNHFGIKCKSNWTGESVKHTDDAKDECFRKYASPEASYIDHSNFLRSNKRYANLFTLRPDDYKGWAYGLKKAGYATNPRYPNILIGHIEKYNLQQYDNLSTENIKHTVALESDPTMSMEVAVSNKTFPDEKAVDKKTLFNGIKASFVKKGTSILAVASRYKIDLSKLLAYNDLKKDGLIEEDQMLYLARKNKEGKHAQYETEQPEKLYDIAQNHGVQLSALMEYNNLREDAVVPAGSMIYLQKNAAATIPENTVSQKDKTHIMHEVQSKEGLYSIARKHGVTVEDLKRWNNLSSDQLSVGQQLIISK